MRTGEVSWTMAEVRGGYKWVTGGKESDKRIDREEMKHMDAIKREEKSRNKNTEVKDK
jgi:hypothetical protein